MPSGDGQSSSECLIRPIRDDDDLAALTRLINAAYKKNLDMGFRFVATWQGPDITAERIAGAHCLIAEVEGKVVGTLTIKRLTDGDEHEWYRSPGTWHLGQFAVEPELQKAGVGRALMDAAEALAFREGVNELSLDTAEGAQHLIDYYQRRGYRIVGPIDHRPETNYMSVIMSKRIRPILRTERLLIRPFSHAELPRIESFWNTPNYLETYPPAMWTEEFGRTILRQFADAAEEWPMRKNRWGIEIDGAIQGTIRLDWDGEARSPRGTIGYGIAERHWGKGFATEAVREVLRYGFEELRMHRIAAWAFANNARSANVLTKCGFTYEGADRSAVRWGDGWMDDARYGIIEDEWRAQNAVS